MASDRSWRNTSVKAVVIDTSAIMMLFEFSIGLEKELTRLLGSYKIIVPSAVIDEIRILKDRAKGKKKLIAKPGLKLAESFEIFNTNLDDADDAVLSVAKEFNGVVFSNDKELRKRAKKEKLKTIYLRSKNHLEINESFV
jgi:rRNA-processing protein FCF1